jgi:hypothetical protein
MNLLKTKRKRWLTMLAALAFVFCGGLGVRAVSFTLSAGYLLDASGNPMPTTGIAVLVASTTDSTFSGPSPGAFVSGDDIIVAKVDLSGSGEPGILSDFVSTTLSGSWNAGDQLRLYWYPTLTISSTGPPAGTPYGAYRADSSIDGGDPWVTPTDSATINLAFLTESAGGSNPDAAGLANLVVATPVEITSQPVSRTNVYGSTATFTVTATGSGTLSYQWLYGSSPLGNGGIVSGATSATLTLSPVALGSAGNYSVIVTGTGGSSTSSVATLTVIKASTTMAAGASVNPALPGQSVNLSGAVSIVSPGSGTPTGSVNFRIDGSVAGSASFVSGVATFSFSTSALGAHTVVAEYAGDSNFNGSTNSLAPSLVINTPPVAGNDTIERYRTQGVKVALATLLANDSDADSDSLTISVSSASANAGAISVSSGWAFYTPASGFTNVDSFTYTITDGRGGSATGTVTVAVKTDTSVGENLVISVLEDNSVLIQGSGVPGRTYHLQYTDSLAPAAWTDLPGGTVTADETGNFDFTDTTAVGQRYYRSLYQ